MTSKILQSVKLKLRGCSSNCQLFPQQSFTLSQQTLNPSTKKTCFDAYRFFIEATSSILTRLIAESASGSAACAQDGSAPFSAPQIEGQTSHLSIIVLANRSDRNCFFDFPFRANFCRKLPALELIAPRPVPNQPTQQQQRHEIKQKLSLKICLIKNKPRECYDKCDESDEESKQRQFRWFAVKFSDFRLTFAFSK